MTDQKHGHDRQRAVVGKYDRASISKRIEAFFLDNVGKIATSQQIQQVARDPKTGKEPENWHQRLSEMRTDSGYTILSKRDDAELRVGEYVLASPEKRIKAGRRVVCSPATWKVILERDKHTCQWEEDGARCLLEDGSVDPIGGGTVRLTADHMTPHSAQSAADPNDPAQWRALCGRHQVMKKNYWDSSTGKLNLDAILQAASLRDRRKVYQKLREQFSQSKTKK